MLRRTIVILSGLLWIHSGCNRHPPDMPDREIIANSASEIPVIRTIDTADIHKSLKYAENLANTNLDSAISIFLDLIYSSRKINYSLGAATAYYNLIRCLQDKGDFQQANEYTRQGVHYIEKAIENAKIGKQQQRVRNLYNYLMILYSRSDAYRKAVHAYRLARPYFDTEDSVQNVQWLEISRETASCYVHMGQYDSASIIYHQALHSLKSVNKNNYKLLSDIYLGLGFVEARINNSPEESLHWFRETTNLGRKYADTSMLITGLGNIASRYYDQQNYKQAKKYALEAIGLAKRLKSVNARLITQRQNAHTLAASLIQEERPGEALPYSKMALQIARELHSQTDEIAALYVTGYNYVALKQYKKAENYLLTGLTLAKQIGQWDNIANAYGQLSVAYFNMGQYKYAYIYRQEYANIRDSLIGKENAARIAEINARYQVAQKDKAIAEKDRVLLQNQLKIAGQQKRQYLWIGGSAACILVLLSLLYRKRYKTKLNQLKAMIAGEEKERTRLARELHDGIVSRLSIIRMNFSALPEQYKNLNEGGDFQEVVDQLEQSISELRTTSHNLLPEILQRAGLAESVNIYCEKIRKIALLDIEFQLIGELPTLRDDFQLNIYRIIQELVNNIIKHSNASHALLQFHTRADWLSITLDDNGTGMTDMPGKEAHSGIGLQSLRDRIQLLDGVLEIETGKGTSVYLEFNLKKFIRK